MNILTETIQGICNPDADSARQATDHWNTRAKLPGSLGLLEQAVTRLAAIQRTGKPRLDKKAAVVLCADNGVVAEAITPSDPSVTAAQAVNFARGGGTINAFCRKCSAQVHVVDVGIATRYEEPRVDKRLIRPGTGNIACGPAMTKAECIHAICTGIQLAQEAANDGIQLLITGEMGIGNTTTSSAVASVLLDMPAEHITARGAGAPERVEHKAAVIRKAISLNRPDRSDPVDILAKVGGLDMAAMCGLYIGCASSGIAVMIDGIISSAAALCAARLAPAASAYMFASHRSAEPAADYLLEALGLSPLITANMCLGEGTGGALAAVLFDCALDAYYDVIAIDEI